jgi:hypothetical protein
MERQVLKSIDLTKHRPQVILIEAVEPRSPIKADYKWEDILLNNSYVLFMFDGLNNYYIAKEHYSFFKKNMQKADSCFEKFNAQCKVNL